MDSESDDDIEACEICHEPYDDDPDLFVGRAEREQSHLPVQSSTCQHFLCYNCVVRKCMADGEKLSDKAFENLKWLKCPFCRRLTSFNTADPNVSHFACQMLRRLRRHRSKETMRPGATDDTTGSGETAPSGASADHSQEEANAPPAAVSAGACTDFAERGDSESIDGDPTDEEQNFPLDAVTAASAATAEEGGEEAVQGAETVADGDISDEDHRPIEENEDILTENIEEVVDPLQGAAISDRNQTSGGGGHLRRTKRSPKPIERYEGCPPSRKKSRDDGMDHVTLSGSSAVSLSSVDKEWLAAISCQDDKKICRIRTFQIDSIRKWDPHGRLCSLWCLKYGYIASCNRIIPDNLLQDPVQALAYLRDSDYESIRESCRESHLWTEAEVKNYCKAERMPSLLRPGDIVIMHMTQEKKSKAAKLPGEAVFGVVIDDSFIVESKSDAINKYDFPWDFINAKCSDPFINGILLRRVKWMRRVDDVRNLPQQEDKQVKWIAMNQTKFCAMVENQPFKNQAFSAMTSQKFLDCTVPIEESWIDQQMTRWSPTDATPTSISTSSADLPVPSTSLRQSAFITRRQLFEISGGTDKELDLRFPNPLRLKTPVTYCGGAAFATFTEGGVQMLSHVVIAEKYNRSTRLPSDSTGELVINRKKGSGRMQKDTKLFLENVAYSFPIFWVPDNQGRGTPRVKYVGHWKMKECTLFEPAKSIDNVLRCAKYVLSFGSYDEHFDQSIEAAVATNDSDSR